MMEFVVSPFNRRGRTGGAERFNPWHLTVEITGPFRLQGWPSGTEPSRAVNDLSIMVERGEIFGFLGPNGAGKTTTMRMLLGLVRPTSGAAVVLDLDVATNLKAILAQTGSIIENPTFYPFLSGLDNLRIVAHLTNTPESRIGEMLALVELAGDAERKFKEYSLGMKQRLAVAASLLDDPALLILDEPGNGLDPAGIVEMRTLMKNLKAAGKTVFISSHVLHEIEQICDRIAIMNHGRFWYRAELKRCCAAEIRSRCASARWIKQRKFSVRCPGSKTLPRRVPYSWSRLRTSGRRT